ncbi:aldo/keto reductase [Brucellaceae bacterium C25G]
MKQLGRTDLQVTEICLGTMTWGVQNSEADAHAQLDYALSQGINFIDTAEGYAVPMSPESYGKTETYIGSWFKKSGTRDKVILASKIAGGGSQKWIRDGAGPNRQNIREAVEDSLRRLQTDYIDLYQIHWPSRPHYHFGGGWKYNAYSADETHSTERVLERMADVLEGLNDMVKEGKIRHTGLSNETAWGVMQWNQLAKQAGFEPMVSIQNEYSLLQRNFDFDLAEVARHEKVGLLAYSPLAAGVLTGKYLDGAMPEGARGTIALDGFWRNNDYASTAVRAYCELAEQHGLDIAQMALAFALTRPFMTSVIIGATSMAQLKTNIASSDVVLSDDVLNGIAEIYRNHPRPL